MEIEFDTDVIQKNEDEVERLKKEIEELKYQIEREKREGDRLKQILAGGSGMLLSPPLSFLLSSSIEKEKNFCAVGETWKVFPLPHFLFSFKRKSFLLPSPLFFLFFPTSLSSLFSSLSLSPIYRIEKKLEEK